MSPQVSVVIPTYNRRSLLREAIASVRAQNFDGLEILIVDHGSTDGTADELRERAAPDLSVISLEHTGTLSSLRNRGLAAARGEFVAFLDSDDLWEPSKLRCQVDLLRANPALGFVQCGYRTFDEHGFRATDLQMRASLGAADVSIGDLFPLIIRARMAMYTSTLMARRSAIQTAGGWNETLRAGDCEWIARLASHHHGAIVHRPLARIRKHSGNMSRDHWEHDFAEAIFTIEQFFAQGAIAREVYDEMASLYHRRFGESLLKHGRPAEAEREFQLCTMPDPKH